MKALTVVSATLIGSGIGISAFTDSPTRIDETIPAAREGIVVVRVPTGQVTVEGWDRDEIRVTGTVPDGPDRFTLTSEHSHAEIHVMPDLDGDPADTKLTIRVPAGSGLDLETDAAEVSVDEVVGVVRLASGSGNLRIAGHPAGLIARSDAGDIDIVAEHSPGFAHSEHGKVTLRGGARDMVAQRIDRRMRDRMRRIDRRVARDVERELGPNLEGLGAEIGAMVADIMDNVNVQLDVDRYDGGFTFDLAGDVNIDPDDLEAMFDDLGDFFADFGDQLGDHMAVIGDEIGSSMEELDAELRDLQRDLERARARRERERERRRR